MENLKIARLVSHHWSSIAVVYMLRRGIFSVPASFYSHSKNQQKKLKNVMKNWIESGGVGNTKRLPVPSLRVSDPTDIDLMTYILDLDKFKLVDKDGLQRFNEKRGGVRFLHSELWSMKKLRKLLNLLPSLQVLDTSIETTWSWRNNLKFFRLLTEPEQMTMSRPLILHRIYLLTLLII